MVTYGEAGVDVEKKNALLAGIKKKLAAGSNGRSLHFSSTLFKSVMAGLNSVKGYANPYLAVNVDGVGTKTIVAEMAGRWESIGTDVVNQSVNDILTMGAKPLFFADYIAQDRLRPAVVETVVEGIKKCCEENDVVFLGGETAEMPDVYRDGRTEVAGFIGGIAEFDRLIDGKGIKQGNILIGLASGGLHTNGFSLVRKVLFEKAGYKIDEHVKMINAGLGSELLKPHRSYLKTTEAVLAQVNVKGIAHITGGSFRKNIPRILPKGLGAEIEKASWKPQAIFELIREAGVEEDEMYSTFNMGIGYVYVVESEDADFTMKLLKEMKETAYAIGKVEKEEGVRFVDRD